MQRCKEHGESDVFKKPESRRAKHVAWKGLSPFIFFTLIYDGCYGTGIQRPADGSRMVGEDVSLRTTGTSVKEIHEGTLVHEVE